MCIVVLDVGLVNVYNKVGAIIYSLCGRECV